MYMYTRLKQHNRCFHSVCASLKRGKYRFFLEKKEEKKWGMENEEAYSKSEEAFEAKTKARRRVPPLPQ